MLTINTLPHLIKVVSKIDIKPIVPMLKNLDIFEEPKNKKDAIKQLSREKIGVLACELFAEITPQLGKIADDIPPLVAAYYDVEIDEARKYDLAKVINDIINDEGIITFFKTALRKKVEQEL